MTVLRLDAFLPYRLSVVSNLVSDAIASTYRSLFGLRIPEWRLIAVIAQGDGEGEGMTQQALTAATRMDKVTVSRAAIALVERGLLARCPHPDDQRSHVLSLTGDGHALYDQVAPKALEMERRILAGLSAAEIAELRRVLDRIEQSVRS